MTLNSEGTPHTSLVTLKKLDVSNLEATLELLRT